MVDHPKFVPLIIPITTMCDMIYVIWYFTQDILITVPEIVDQSSFSAQQTQTRQKEALISPQVMILARVCGGEITEQGWWGRHMSETGHIGELWGCKGCPSISQYMLFHPRCIRASWNGGKKHNCQNNRPLQKWSKRKNSQNNIKCHNKKIDKKRKEDKTRSERPRYIPPSSRAKISRQKKQRTARNDEFWSQTNYATTNRTN